MIWFVLVMVLVIVGGSVLVGRSLSKPKGEGLTSHDKMTALKASGALRNRKESRR